MMFKKKNKYRQKQLKKDPLQTDQGVQISDLNFAYDENQILKNINLTFKSGFTAIIGPNGSGKSTLMKLLTANLESNNGSLSILGQDLKDLKPLERARIFAVISQNQSFSFPFTCMEMVGHGRYARRTDFNHYTQEDYDVIVDCMKKTATLKFKDHLMTELSGGEQQRVILAAALAQQPKILFLDEAFSAMDISYKVKFLKLLKALISQENLQVVAIMHDLNMAYLFADEVCMLSEGEVYQMGTVEETMTEKNILEVFDVAMEKIEGKGFQIKI